MPGFASGNGPEQPSSADGLCARSCNFHVICEKIPDDPLDAYYIFDSAFFPAHRISDESGLCRAGGNKCHLFLRSRGLPPDSNSRLQRRLHRKDPSGEFRKIDLYKANDRRAVCGDIGEIVSAFPDDAGRRVCGKVEGDGGKFGYVPQPVVFQGFLHKPGAGIGAYLDIKRRVSHKHKALPRADKLPLVLVDSYGLVPAAPDALAAVNAKFRDDFYEAVDDTYGFGGT